MVLDLLGRLASKSLVEVERPQGTEGAEEAGRPPGGPSKREPGGGAETDPGRYRMLEMIRQYAGEKLQESEEEFRLRGRHRNWLLALTEEALPQLSGPDQTKWLERLIGEYPNLRAALGQVTARDDPSLEPERLARWGRVVEQLVPTYRRTGRIEAARAVLGDYIALCQACEYARGLARGCTLLGHFLQ